MRSDATTVAAANPPITVRSEAMFGMEVDEGLMDREQGKPDV